MLNYYGNKIKNGLRSTLNRKKGVKMNLSEKLVSIRAKNHLTQKQLAEKLHVTTLTVSKIETGRQQKVSRTLAYNIEALLEKGE